MCHMGHTQPLSLPQPLLASLSLSAGFCFVTSSLRPRFTSRSMTGYVAAELLRDGFFSVCSWENVVTGTNLMFQSTLLGPLSLTDGPDRRQRIRSHIRMVMEQLEEVLIELKDVARELREVVTQIDKLTAGIDLDTEDDPEEDKVTLACSSNSSERALGDLLKAEVFSNKRDLHHLLHYPLLDTAKRQETVLHRRSCGDLPALNGPIKVPYSPKASWLFGSGEKIHHCDKALYHALCCDDDDFDEESGGRRSSRFSSDDSVFSSSPPRPLRVEALTPRSARKCHLSPGSKKKALRSCSTQTVSDKSTQTPFPYSPA